MDDQRWNKNEDWEKRFLRWILQLMDTRNCILLGSKFGKWNGRQLFFVPNFECWDLLQNATEDMKAEV